jgi:hypothetical protein
MARSAPIGSSDPFGATISDAPVADDKKALGLTIA